MFSEKKKEIAKAIMRDSRYKHIVVVEEATLDETEYRLNYIL
jgi:hypothetical protein